MTPRRNSHMDTAARVALAIHAAPTATLDELARAAHVSRRTVIRAIHTLTRTGILVPRAARARIGSAREVTI